MQFFVIFEIYLVQLLLVVVVVFLDYFLCALIFFLDNIINVVCSLQ